MRWTQSVSFTKEQKPLCAARPDRYLPFISQLTRVPDADSLDLLGLGLPETGFTKNGKFQIPSVIWINCGQDHYECVCTYWKF